MNRKRTLLNNISDIKKKKFDFTNEKNLSEALPTDTRSALFYLSCLFPVEKFQNRLPAIIMKHQIYAFVKCRTEVDRYLNEMRKKGEIRLFKLGQNDDEIAIVYMEDYKQHVQKCCPNNAVLGSFLNIISHCPDISFSKNVLANVYGMKEENISELIQHGVLISRDVGCYWLSIPQMGEFIKTFLYGRRAVLQCIKRTKYKEILQSELQKRKLPQKAQLNILYHIYDIIGSDSVTCVNTSTGTVLRLQPELTSG